MRSWHFAEAPIYSCIGGFGSLFNPQTPGEKRQPTGSDLFIGPSGYLIGPGSHNNMIGELTKSANKKSR
jgi:hypothetical protein